MAMDGHHGNTWANWLAVATGLVGVTVASVGVLMQPVGWLMFWIGLAVFALSPLVAVLLNRAGTGASH